MPLYTYSARDKEGKIKQGLKEGQNQEEVLASLQTSGLLVTQITETLEVQKAKKKQPKQKLHKKVKLVDLLLMSRQLATLVGAGVTLLRSIEIILQQVSSEKLRKTLEAVRDDIRAGQPFYAALSKHPKVFSDFWVNLIRTGEAGGQLAQTLDRLSGFLEEQAALQRKVISAMIYPMILITLSTLVVAGFLLKIVPIFTGLFRDFGIELPLLTKAVIFMSDLLREKLPFLLIVGGGGFFLLRIYLSSEKGKWMWDRLLLKMPLMGELTRKVAVSNFAKSLGTLIRSGVPILYALEIVAKTSGNRVVRQVLEDVRMEVREGRSIAEPLGEGDIFDPIVIQMIRVGEEIGELGSMLDKIARFYDEQVEATTSRVVALIEPLAIVVMGLVIGVLVISMYLPIFSLSQLGDKTGL